jgi:hypothetical protein
VLQADAEVTAEDPFTMVDLAIQVLGFPLSEDGVYTFDIFADELKHLNSRTFKVVKIAT